MARCANDLCETPLSPGRNDGDRSISVHDTSIENNLEGRAGRSECHTHGYGSDCILAERDPDRSKLCRHQLSAAILPSATAKPITATGRAAALCVLSVKKR